MAKLRDERAKTRDHPGLTAERLRQRMDDLIVDQKYLVTKLGVSQGAISQILTGRTKHSRLLPRLAQLLGVSLSWLMGTSPEKFGPQVEITSVDQAAEQLDSVLVPLYEAPLALGAGAAFDETVKHELIPFKKAWLRGRIAGRLDQVMMIPGRGDAMKPTIYDGDILLVDRAQVEVREPDQTWAFAYGDTSMVKRLRRLPQGGFLVQSDNALIREFQAADEEVRLVGRVVSILRWQ